MRAFVTGGTGFVGSHLVEALINSPDYNEVKCLVRSGEKWLSGLSYTRVTGDLNNFSAISVALQNVDVVFHVAGIVRSPSEKEFTNANVNATETLMRLAHKKGISNFVMLSSLAATGPSSGVPLTEKTPMHPVSMYGQSKKRMESIIKKTAASNDSIKIIRPPAVYGPRETDIFQFFKTFSMGLCPIVGDGNHPKLSLVYVKDLVDGIMKAALKNDPGIHTYFMGGEHDAYSWNQIREITAKVTGKNPVTIKLRPEWIKKIASVIESGASVFGKYPVVNKEKATEMVEEWVCSSVKARKELAYAPETSIEEGLSRTIHWYKNNNWL